MGLYPEEWYSTSLGFMFVLVQNLVCIELLIPRYKGRLARGITNHPPIVLPRIPPQYWWESASPSTTRRTMYADQHAANNKIRWRWHVAYPYFSLSHSRYNCSPYFLSLYHEPAPWCDGIGGPNRNRSKSRGSTTSVLSGPKKKRDRQPDNSKKWESHNIKYCSWMRCGRSSKPKTQIFQSLERKKIVVP